MPPPAAPIKSEPKTLENPNVEPAIASELEVQNVCINLHTDEIKSKLTEIGALVVDEDDKVEWCLITIIQTLLNQPDHKNAEEVCSPTLVLETLLVLGLLIF